MSSKWRDCLRLVAVQTERRARFERFGRQKVQNEIDETRARLRAVLDKASAVEARNLRREQELDAREKALTSTFAPSELSDERAGGARCGRTCESASDEDALRITSELLANDDASRAAAFRTSASDYLRLVESSRQQDAPVAFVAPGRFSLRTDGRHAGGSGRLCWLFRHLSLRQ